MCGYPTKINQRLTNYNAKTHWQRRVLETCIDNNEVFTQCSCRITYSRYYSDSTLLIINFLAQEQTYIDIYGGGDVGVTYPGWGKMSGERYPATPAEVESNHRSLDRQAGALTIRPPLPT